MIYQNLTDIIGGTPMLEISGLDNQKGRLLLKLECFNPGGSIKDRTALSMIEDAESKGLLKEGATIIEPTSGNTGVGLAWIGAVKGYKTIFTMPDTMSLERRNLLKAYGATIVLTPGAEGMTGSIRKAEELCREISGAFMPGQFTNPSNPAIHERTTGEEIWNDTEGEVDIFVAGVGTGGTLSGVGQCLKRHKSSVEIVAVEPENSPVLSGGSPGVHGLQGIGPNFIPQTYDARIVDKIVSVSDNNAFEAARFLARKYGILAGISSGAAFHAALLQATSRTNAGKMIVALLPDTGERYLSTGIFD